MPWILACLGVIWQLDAQPLPRLDWGTYQGGSAADALRDIETDAAGNIYVIGSTSSASGIATSGAQQPGISSPPDAYIAKFNPRGQLIWSTYLGGEGSDQGQHLALDTSGYLYVSGFTSSTTGIATPGAHQTALQGMNDAFVAKFDTNGTRLWASYFGGSEGETCNGVTVDGDGHVTIVGWTNSNDNIASPGAHQLIFRGQQDIFIAQFDSFGNRRWSTYFGDIGFDIGLQIEATETGDLVIAGWTSSVINIASPGAHQTGFTGGTADACLIKFSATGSRIWSTYYGGPTDEYGDALALAANGDILLAGPTNSPFGLATGGTHQAAPAGAFDGYVARFDPDGNRLWGTYYGGPDIDVLYGIGESPSGDILITGHTRSTTGISTPPTHQPASGGDWDAFLAALNADGERQWGTYYGGPGIDQSFGLAMDSLGFMYLAGFTNSSSGVSTPGALQESPAGGNESLVARFAPCHEPVLTLQNGGYLCDGSDFVMDLVMTGSPPFAITYSLDGVVQPILVADTAHFYHLITTSWSDSIKLISVSSGPCMGVIAGPTDFVVAADPVTVSNLQIACDQDNLTYFVSGQLSGGLFGYLDAGGTPVMITDSQFVTGPLPFAQAYAIGITSGLLCDTLLLQAASGCTVICPDSFGVTGPDTVICNGSDISLFAAGGIAYAWSGPDGFFSMDAAPIIPAAAEVHAGLYTVIITDPRGCQDTLSTLVNIQTIAGSLQGDPIVCEGSAFDLVASGGIAYAWSGPDGFSSAIPDPIISNTTLAQGGTYTVTLTDDLGCTTTLSIDIAIAPRPDIALSFNSPVCEGEGLSLSATGGTMYAWSGPGGYTGNQQTVVRPGMGADDAGEYVVLVTTADGCIDSAVAEVIVLPAPMLALTILQPVCAGGELALLGQGAESYAWSGPNGFMSDLANPVISPIDVQQTGAYTLVGTAANGCRDTITQDITVQPIPPAIATSDRPVYCEGDTAMLSVSAASAYAWTGPLQFTSDEQAPVLPNLTLLQEGVYQVTITDDHGCRNTAVVTLSVDTAPGFQLVYDLIGCEGDSVSAVAVGDTGTYQWTGPNGFSASGIGITVPAVDGDASGPYILTVTNAGGCTRRDSVWFDIRPRPEAGITGPDTICAGSPITLTATGGGTYMWAQGPMADILMVSPQVTTRYTVFVSSGPCRDTAEWTVHVRPLPALSITAPAEIDIGETAALSVAGAYNYSWLPADDLSCLTCPDPIVSPGSTTTYCVTGELDGCVADTCVTVAVREECVLALPNVITPNSDGINDTWCNPKPACADEQYLTIYDRWGNAQYRQSGPDVCWDGRIRGEPANPGVFVFVLEMRRTGKESQYIRGDITVLR